MSKIKSKRQLRLQLTLIYSMMVLAVVAIVSVLVLVLQGYRFNRYDGKLEQGGLVQFNSQPTGAGVTVDNTLLTNKTASKIVLTAGAHHIEMARDGYSTWAKDVTVKPGNVLWLNYALLYPTNPTVKTVATYPGVASAMAAPKNNKVALIPDATLADVTITSLTGDAPVSSTIHIPDATYTAPADGAKQRFNIVEWDKDGNVLLIKHTTGDVHEYLTVDIRNPDRTVNVSTTLGLAIDSIAFAKNDSNKVYMLLASHELRRATLSSPTISGPLATNVSSFTVTEPNVVVYQTRPDTNKQRLVGYVSSDSTTAKVLSSYTGIGNGALMATTGTYYGDHYVAIVHGDTMDILKGNLPSSDSDAVLALQHVAAVPARGGAQYIGFSPDDDRMIYVAKDTNITVYDLELDTTNTTTLSAPLTRDVNWLDGYHIAASGAGGYYYDFDGTNGQRFASDSIDQPAVLGSTKYLYYFAKSDTQVVLKRISLTR